jgi:tRNA pseudouridine65 synthase
MDIECLYEDDELFVLNKPSGLVIHRGWAMTEAALVDFARSRTADGAAHPIQRLDRSASGAVLFARNAALARTLSALAEAGHCRKEYLALARGEVADQLDIDHPISRREDGPRVDARTLVRRIAVAQTEPRHVSLVSATPLTGRLHQIRRHLKHANHPLIGDVKYGHGDLNRAFRSRYGLARLALHAYRWSIERPGSERILQGLVPLPDDLSEPLIAMGFALGPGGLPRGFDATRAPQD